MRISLEQIALVARREYGSKGFKITRTEESVYVDHGAFYLVLSESNTDDSVSVGVGWQVENDTVSSTYLHCTLDGIVPAINSLCYALIDNLTAFIQEVPNETQENPTGCVVASFDPSGISLPIG